MLALQNEYGIFPFLRVALGLLTISELFVTSP